jgi:hypothetical protein
LNQAKNKEQAAMLTHRSPKISMAAANSMALAVLPMTAP